MKLSEAYHEYKGWIWIGIIILLNLLVSDNPASLDLTEDKRYSLTPATIDLLQGQRQRILVEVLYEGDFPAGYKRLQLSVKDILRKMRSYNNYLVVRFQDPKAGDDKAVKDRMEAFAQMGLVPVPISFPGSKEFRATQAFPYAVVSQDQKTVIVPLLDDISIGGYNENKLNKAVAALEYKFANAFQKINQTSRRKIAILDGINGLNESETIGMQKELSKFYQIGRFSLDSVPLINPEVEVLIVPGPGKMFSDRALFTLDQYLMNGGNIIWLIDALHADNDSLRTRSEYAPYARETGVNNLLFNYGVRVNADLVVDLNAGTIPLATSSVGGKPQYDFFPWYYHILPEKNLQHPISLNIGDVKLYFPSSIDTLRTDARIKKTILLSSSDNARIQNIPRPISFEITRYPVDESYFNTRDIKFGVLLEGTFSSFYNNRMTSDLEEVLASYGQEFVSQSKPITQLVISDADFIKTIYAGNNGVEVAPGYDFYEKRLYEGNLNIIVNAVEYMLGNADLLTAKAKEVKLRLLNTVKADRERGKWQLINLGLPLLFLSILGLMINFIRKRKYTAT